MAYFSDAPPPSPPCRVVITGPELTFPAGPGSGGKHGGIPRGAHGLLAGDTLRRLRQRVRTAGQRSCRRPHHGNFPENLGPGWHRGTRLAWFAAREAMADAGLSRWPPPVDRRDFRAAMADWRGDFKQSLAGTAGRVEQLPAGGTLSIAAPVDRNGAGARVSGPLRIVSNACASGQTRSAQAFHIVPLGSCGLRAGGRLRTRCASWFSAGSTRCRRSVRRASPALLTRHGTGWRSARARALWSWNRRPRRRRCGCPGVIARNPRLRRGHRHPPSYAANPQGDTALLTMQAACAMAGLRSEQMIT